MGGAGKKSVPTRDDETTKIKVKKKDTYSKRKGQNKKKNRGQTTARKNRLELARLPGRHAEEYWGE